MLRTARVTVHYLPHTVRLSSVSVRMLIIVLQYITPPIKSQRETCSHSHRDRNGPNVKGLNTEQTPC